MRDVRSLTQQWAAKRGHPIKLGARVSTLPDAAKGLGMDCVMWVREGLVDMLVPTPFWATTDFDIPIELWRERIGGAAKNIALAAGAEILVRSYPAAKPIEADLTSTRGFAAAGLQRGADSICLFNCMDPGPMTGGKEAYQTLLQEGLGLETVTRRPRRHVVTYRDTVAPSMSSDVVLPVDGFKGGTFRIYIGPATKKADAFVVAGLAQSDGMAASKFEITVNGKKCNLAADLVDLSLFSGVARTVQQLCPADSLRDGYNEIQIKQLPSEPQQKIAWVALRIVPR